MKAIIANEYGAPEVLVIKELDKPSPKENEILIQIKAASLNSADVRLRALDVGDGLKGAIAKIAIRLLLGFNKPKRVQGSVLSGEVVEVGNQVTRFKPSDEVYAMTGLSLGAFAEYCALPDKRAIALKPKTASHEEACTIPFGGTAALYFLRKANIKSGDKILIYGSTGAVGTSAVQIAAYFGGEVSAVCGPDGIALTKVLGATTVYDYTKNSLDEITGTFNIVFDAVGKITKTDVNHLLAADGHYITVNGLDAATEKSADLEELAQMYDAGKLVATIDKKYDLDEIIEANRYVDSGRKRGSVVIRIS